MTKPRSLSPPQAELLQAINDGVVVNFMRATRGPCYYFRNDNHQPCTKAALALMRRELVSVVSEGKFGGHKLVRLGQADQGSETK